MHEIAITAAPYCFGPTSKALCIASHLAQTYKVSYIGMPPGTSLARAAKSIPVIDLSDRDEWCGPSLEALVESACLLSALESRAVRVAQNHHIPVIFLDTLSWLRTAPPPQAEQADVYVAQAFFRQPSQHFLQCLGAFVSVGPVFSPDLDALAAAHRPCDGSDILINFGGLTSPAMVSTADTAYVEWVLRALQLTQLPSSQLTVCLPLQLASLSCMARRHLPDATILTPSLHEFHKLLDQCAVLVTVPGLESILEAMYLRRPLVFLPPHNGTQAMQLRVYRDYGIGACLPSSSPDIALNALDLHELTRTVQCCNRRNAYDITTTALIADHVATHVHALTGNSSCADRVTSHNHALLQTLGTPGRAAVAQLVDALAER